MPLHLVRFTKFPDNIILIDKILLDRPHHDTHVTNLARRVDRLIFQVSSSVDGITYIPEYVETTVTLKGTLWFEAGR